MYIFSYFNIIYLFLLFFTCRENTGPVKKESKQIIHPNISTDYFINPLKRPIVLAGTFCELRPNHFHTGIDIKSAAGVVGDPVYAAADGFVSRVSISPDGYGNAIYIDHPNGFTTVYGHLLQIYPALDSFVKSEQARLQRFDVELYLEKNQFKVSKGVEIAKMGNTGSSRGAHLHFEIRETETENPVNPLLFGLKVFDNIAPAINYFRTYSINNQWDVYDVKNVLVKKRGGIYVPRIGNDTLLFQNDTIGIGINTRDQMNGTWNKNGVYLIKMYCDDTLKYMVRMDSASFYKTRMVNAHMDYPEVRTKRNYIHKCFTLPGNNLSEIRLSPTNGLITVNTHQVKKIMLEVFDFNKNKSTLTFFAKIDTLSKDYQQDKYDYFLYYDRENKIRTQQAKIDFPRYSFFRNIKFHYVESADKSSNFYSMEHQLGSEDIPVFGYFALCIKSSAIVPDKYKNKCFIASCDNRGRIRNWGGQWVTLSDTLSGTSSLWMQSDVKEFGNYFITLDTLAPKVIPIIFGKNMQNAKKIVFKIEDNIAPAGRTPLLNYKAFIDDKWALFDYDLKTQTITYHFEKLLPRGEHTLVLEVFDAMNNTKRYEAKFIR